MIATSSIGNERAVRLRNRWRRARGFTLIELLVVLALIAVSLAIVGPRLGHSLDASRLKASARALTAAAREARNIARSEQRDVLLTISVDKRTFRIDDEQAQAIAPTETNVSVTGAQSERRSANTAGIRFFADGSATGGLIKLSLKQLSFSIEVDWLTGMARIN